MNLALSRTALILALTAIMGSLSAGWNQYPVLYRILSGHPCIWVFYLTKYTFFNHFNLLSNSLKMVLKIWGGAQNSKIPTRGLGPGWQPGSVCSIVANNDQLFICQNAIIGYQAPFSVASHSGQFSIHFSHQDSVYLCKSNHRDWKSRWFHLSFNTGAIPQCLATHKGWWTLQGLGA